MALARNFLTASTGTAASRLLGFVRDMLIAATLGAGPVADAFVVAFRLPNLFRRLFSEGALNPAFVPVYARLRAGAGEEAAARFAGEAVAGFALAALALVALAEIGMAGIVFLLAPGFVESPEKFALAVVYARIAFPFLGFAGLASLYAALLAARGRFVAAAYAPVAVNVVLVGALFFIDPAKGQRAAGATLCVGVALAGLAQLLVCLVAVKRAGLMPAWRAPRWSADMRAVALMSGPAAFVSGVAQINAFVGAIVGSSSPSAVSYLYYADRVYQLPLGIAGVAIGLALLPALAQRLSEGDDAGARAAQRRAIEFALATALPAALALALLAGPIVDVLFRRGAFDLLAARETARTLAAFAFGLPAYVLAKALQPAFFARGAMRAPLLVAIAGAALDVALSLALFGALQHVGVALAASAAGWLNAFGLALLLHRRGLIETTREEAMRLLRIVAAAAAMAAALALGKPALAPWLAPFADAPARIAALALLCGGGLAVYVVAAQVFGAFDLRVVRAALRRDAAG